MTGRGAPSAPPDPRDPDWYNRGPYWPGERLRPLVLGPADYELLAANAQAVARLASGARP
ncbi:hypothetical protein [Streptomyces niveus]|uniref:hypothetical protein n=1 Tax=Streptomyces niveus TaxID=193462 RepID=UPI00084CB8FD|nr:hypothetical protein [Streptomyces niveus]